MKASACSYASRYSLPASAARTRPQRRAACHAKRDRNAAEGEGGLKAAWLAAELFGNVMGSKAGDAAQPTDSSHAAMSRQDVLESLRKDYYEHNYFVSGTGAMDAYEQDCKFVDDFNSFRGVQRFKRNVQNLGSMLQDVKLDVVDWRERDDKLVVRWRFSSIVTLPWQPRLAAAGSTTHIFDATTGKVVEHIERWETEPAAVLQKLLEPASQVPRNAWETFFMSLSDGDVKGMWFVLSGQVAKLAAAALVVSVALRLVNGDGLGGAAEATCAALLLVVAVTEVTKLAQGMQGGDTGTGGRF